MPAATTDQNLARTTSMIADAAVQALHDEVDLTPKPGLVDRRGPGTHSDMNREMLHASAEALRPAFERCARAATSLPVGTALRACIGRVGRAGERAMLEATAGVNTHRGALWALGLLCAAAAVTNVEDGFSDDVTAFAAALARIPDPVAGNRPALPIPHGTVARYRYGVTGARGEAQAAFPNVRQHALPALTAARRDGADERSARLDALVALMAHVDDTCVLHRGGREGLYVLQVTAQAVTDAGGVRTPEGYARFVDLDRLCARRNLSPGGSADLLAAALFIDMLDRRT